MDCTGLRTSFVSGERNPPWLLLFLMTLLPFFWFPVMCSRVLPPDRTVSDRRDIDMCTPCARAMDAGGSGRALQEGLSAGSE